MYKINVSKLLALSLTGALLVGCSDDSSSSDESTSEEVGTAEDSDLSSESTEDSSEETTEEDGSSTEENGEDESNDESDSQSSSNDIQLEMDSSKVLLPTTFPNVEKSSLSTNIVTNNPDQYTVEYLTEQDQSFVEVSGTMYKNSDLANEELSTFTDGKTVGKIEENSTDLGHDITGYGEGAAGTQYFGWSEGNWQFLIESASEDQMNNPDIAKQMVEFLQENYLPAPDDTGMVYVNYPAGGDEVNVNIRWQDQEMVYQLMTSEVPLDALEMTTSFE